MKYISAIIVLWSLFTACDMGGGSESVSDRKAAVRIVIDAAGIQGRTVKPALALQDVTEWELLGGTQGTTETTLARFASAADASISIDAGTWDFTLVGYKESAVILKGSITGQTISSTAMNTLNFTVAPVLDGEGAISITIELPAGSGITEAQVFKDGQLHATIAPVDDKVAFEGAHTAGAYYFSIRLYKGNDLYGAVSEAVHVWTNLLSEKTYTLTNEDLNLTYIITYHLWDEETENGYYRNTDAVTLITPSRTDYAFKGWYESADYSGDAVSAIPVDSEGDKDFYAKWTAVEQTPSDFSLEESLAWISTNAKEGGAYVITVNANEAISPTILYYTVDNVSIALNGGDVERTVSLSANGALFTVNSGVTLTLGNNITLQGRSDNTAGLIQVNEGGTLTMDAGSKLIGNNNTSASIYGGGVLVNGGTFTVNGGTISGNTAFNGGGVYASDGTFTMSGGTINDNTASASSDYSNGGGVYASGGTFVMNGGEISGNTASSSSYNSYGGGVYVSSSGTFTMNGGAISGNTASATSYPYYSYGGGVYVSSGIFTMNGGAISGNTASSSSYYSRGGGVFVDGSGTFAMGGGTISGNTASTTSSSYYSYGGGVYVNSSGTFIKQLGGVIYGSNAGASLRNTTTSGGSYGHAVYVGDGKFRSTTAGIDALLDSSVSGSAGGWETSISYSSLVDSLAWISTNAVEGGVYTVTVNNSESIGPQTLSYNGKNVNITLNGGSAGRTVSLSSNGSLFTINSGVTLTLGNNVTLQGRSSNTAGLVRVNTGGALSVNEGAKISGNSNTSNWGGGVYVDGGVVTMNGGEISGNTASAYGGGGVYINSGIFTMGDGSISGNTAGINGGGVYVNSSGTFTKQGGAIYGSNASDDLKNTATNSTSYGHAVYVTAGSKLRSTTAGVDVTLDSSLSGSAGGWEELLPSGLSLTESLAWISTNVVEGGLYTITIRDDYSIAPQTLSYSGKNVKIMLNGGGNTERTISLSSTGSLFTVDSGVTLTLGNNITLQGRSDNTTSLVQVNDGGTLAVNNGSKVSGNASSTNGGGVYVADGGTFTKQSGGIIYGSDADEGLKNTTANGDGYGHAVYAEGSPVKIRDTTAGEGVTMDSTAGGWEIVIFLDLSLAESLAWISSNAVEGGVYTITLNAGESIGTQTLYYSGKNVNITLNGGSAERTVSLSSTGRLFSINSGVTLTLENNVTLQGFSDNTDSLVYVYSDGALVMNAGSKISGNTASAGGGVYVNGGTFTMNGGAVSGNRATYYGGGVYVVNSGTFTMSGGAISDNTSYYYSGYGGGGVYVSSSGAFTMEDGEISGNQAYYGGGVYVDISGTFTMSDGEISGNTASNGSGGGVFLYSSGVFMMSGGAISGNTASGNGGGVYVYGSGTFTMSGGEISGNTSSYGGGMYVGSGTFTMSNGEISGNTATSSGGGVYMSSSGAFTMEGGEISNNTASTTTSSYAYAYGGGVFVGSGTFTMKGGKISNNTASTTSSSYYASGGGVSVGSGTFMMEGGEISNNTASTTSSSYYASGGGVYVDSSGTFTKQSDGTIYGSNADEGLKNTTTSGDSYGHAVYVSSGSKKRNTTAGVGVTLNSGTSGSAGGWE